MRLLLTLRRFSGLVGMAVLLGGCASMASVPVAHPVQPESVPFALNGRLSISFQQSRQSAGLRWIHQVQADEILLLSPLGQTVARVYRDAHLATMDSGGKHYQSDSVESLMDNELGWFLPLGGLHHWVLGMPDTDTPAQIERAENGQISVLKQDGWEVRYLHFVGNTPDSLPTRLQLNNEALQVQLLIDEWDWNPQ